MSPSLDAGNLAILLLFGGPCVVAIIGIIAYAIKLMFCHSRDVSLKMRMVDSGMSAAEIERVINAGRGGVPQVKTPGAKVGKPGAAY